MSKPIFALFFLWVVALGVGCFSELNGAPEELAGEELPGPVAVYVEIKPIHGERICLARKIEITDTLGGVYRASPGDCSSFGFLLAPGAELGEVKVNTRIAFLLSVDY